MNAVIIDADAAVAWASSSIEAMSTPELCRAVAGLCQAERQTEWLLCRHLAELADRFQRNDPALGAYSDIYQLARLRYRLGVRRTRERVRIYECTACERTAVETGAGPLELDAGGAARLGCGAKRIDLETEGRETTRGGPIPAAVRRAVLLRDRMRCRSPGCHRRRYVDVHHIHAREHGGEHSRANCVTLCTSCHDRVHDGRLQISGDAEGDLVFRDGSGQPVEGPDPATRRGHAGGGFTLSEAATRILALMGPRGVWITDVLQERTALAIPQLSATLIELELAGRVRRTASGSGYEVLS